MLEQLIKHGPGEIAAVFAKVFELAMQIERERLLGASLYERTLGARAMPMATGPSRSIRPRGPYPCRCPKLPGTMGSPSTRSCARRGATRSALSCWQWPSVHQRRFHPPSRGGDARVRYRVPVFRAGQPRRQAARRRTGSLAQPSTGRDQIFRPSQALMRCNQFGVGCDRLPF